MVISSRNFRVRRLLSDLRWSSQNFKLFKRTFIPY